MRLQDKQWNFSAMMNLTPKFKEGNLMNFYKSLPAKIYHNLQITQLFVQVYSQVRISENKLFL